MVFTQKCTLKAHFLTHKNRDLKAHKNNEYLASRPAIDSFIAHSASPMAGTEISDEFSRRSDEVKMEESTAEEEIDVVS